MADVQSDSEDSRTLLAGRKRNFEEASQDQDNSRTADLREEDESHKRVKGDSNNGSADMVDIKSRLPMNSISTSVHPSKPEAVTVFSSTGAASFSLSPPKHEVEKVADMAESPRQLIGSEAILSPHVSNDNAMETKTSPPPAVEAPIAMVAPPKPSWNSGIQTGLRTSFGSKKARLMPTSVPEPESVVEGVEKEPIQQRDVPDSTGPSQNQSSRDTDNGNEVEDVTSSTVVQEQRMEIQTEKAKKKRRKKSKGTSSAAEPDPPVERPPFKKLKWKQLQNLSEAERAAYKRTKRLYEASDPERKRRIEERKELERQKRIAKEQSLTKKPQPHRDAEKLQKDADISTAVVAEVLARVKKWPLPAEQSNISGMVDKGMTWYPRKFNKPAIYKRNNAEFLMWPVLDHGLPVQFEDVSFEMFVARFITDHADKMLGFEPVWLEAAFNKYMSFYYTNHYHDIEKRRVKISEMLPPTHDSLTLNQAIRQLMDKVMSSQEQSALSSKSQDDTKSSSHEAKAELISASDNFIMLEDNGNDNSDDDDNDDGGDDDDDEDDDEDSYQSSSSEGEVLDLDLNETQIFLQRKYFPSSTGTTTATSHCLACSRIGHDSSNCPSLICTSCSEAHPVFQCPERQRCLKCRERGHTKAQCPEKLGVPKSEWQCDFCDSKEHLEDACHRIWRSFDPSIEQIHTVRDIPVDCYSCGGSNHFGPECGLLSGSNKLLTGGITWSRANVQRYIDPASDKRAVSAGVDYSIPPKKGFSIKGKANDPITFDDSSDDGIGFIRPKVQTAQRGHIRFNGRDDNDPVHGLPRRPASPIAPYRNGHTSYDGGFRGGEESRYGMPSDRYPTEPPLRSRNLGDRAGNSYRPSGAGDNSGYRARVSKNNAPKSGRGRGRGR
jgi:hypothetical protein